MSELERLEQGLAAGQWVSLAPEADAAPFDPVSYTHLTLPTKA